MTEAKTRAKKITPLNSAILDMVEELRGGPIREETAHKITMRILGADKVQKPPLLTPEEIRSLRENAHMSQAVFAGLLNVTTGYLSQLERGAKRPTGAALALLNVIKRKGVDAIL